MPGQCRRLIARSLNVLNRFANLTEQEIYKAFAKAADGEPVILSFSSRDFRHIGPEVEYARYLLETVCGDVFGPQPFFAIKTRSNRYIHDNLDCSTDQRSWRYVFDVESIWPEDVCAIGVGTVCSIFYRS